MMELSSGSHSEESEVGQTLLHTPQLVTALKRKLQQMPSEPPYDNVSWKKKLSVPGMDWSTCRGRFKKVSVHANMTLLIGGPHGLFVNCSESQENNNTCQWYNVSAPHFNRTQTGLWHQRDELLNWYNRGLSPPRPQIISPVLGPEHWHLWKIPACLSRFSDWYAYAHVSIPQNYTVGYNYAGYVHACVNAPCLFAIGQFRSNGSILSCTVVCILV